jgi:hypothetical protein
MSDLVRKIVLIFLGVFFLCQVAMAQYGGSGAYEAVRDYLKRVATNIQAASDNVYDLGSSARRWRDGHFGRNLRVDGKIYGGGDLILSGDMIADGDIYAHKLAVDGADPTYFFANYVVVGNEADRGRASMAGDLYVQNVLESDGNVYVGAPSVSWAGMNVGVGNAAFGKNVEVDGALYVDGFIYGNGSKLTGILAGSTISGLTPNNVSKANGTGTGLIDSAIYSLNGLVGIGTAAPQAVLSIKGNGTNPPFSVSSSASTTGDYITVTSTGNVGVGTATPGASFDTGGTVNRVLGSRGAHVGGGLEVDGTSYFGSQMNVTSAGYFGIGTTAPGAKLDIGGGTVTGVLGSYGLHVLNGMEVDGVIYCPNCTSGYASCTAANKAKGHCTSAVGADGTCTCVADY